MNILFVGDIVGKSGRNVVNKFLPFLQEKYDVDFTIVNGENSAHGKGISLKIYNQLKNLNVDVITLGNHAFSKKEILNHLDETNDLIRPFNMNIKEGNYIITKTVHNKKISVLSMLGNIFMDVSDEDPFVSTANILKNLDSDIVIVDFHAEATSEKALFFEYFKDKLSAVIGTHTHVQTADERIKDGCAFISDVGMCGAIDSILGRDIEEVIDNQIYKNKTRYKPADGRAVLSAVLLKFDDISDKAISIERIQIREENYE